ncbi:UNVERIFIED_CONTAM: Ubiquitin carboxyl-terminal hydrolase MINDY-1 [Sesamum radiatum]|uniref:Ubiquitin carboxyl-terminal hydrolase MINDY-1 n=1 Tax=Sesamum radiatum TaxID=300843 RepID=A0AAW2L229_SESRA
MDSPPLPSSQSASASAASPPPPPEVEVKREEREKEMVHRTKVIQFLGRTTPIILQNDNGPCPLLAICNVLSLKNSLNLSPDISEVSQEKLLSLVAERLIDTNINIDNKDAGYVENQQQNIADAIDLLPRLTTGIDVNIKFRRIDDFEFTPECAIFDLLDIPLYHGWIVDPQDHETADAISSKSYNTLMGELVSLETQIMESEQKNNPEEDSVDFVAATTAALGVPSPCLSRGQSFDDSPPHKERKGDIEEEAELLRVLKLSEAEGSNSTDGVVGAVNLHESAYVKDSEPITLLEKAEKNFSDETVKTGTLISDDSNALNNHLVDLNSPEVFLQDAISNTDQDKSCMRPTYEESRELGDTVVGSDVGIENGKVQSVSSARDSPSLLEAAADSNSSAGQMHQIDEPEAFSSSVDDSEPIYEGEECILESGTIAYESREPVYEGEVSCRASGQQRLYGRWCPNSKERISIKQGEIIRNFLRNSASQLTIYGLFCLQDKVKERELCVFFRNNHFNTMFKYEGELYILATDQGYINQPDLVWEKLNEVNGDTVYMTGNFKEFKMDDHSSGTWDEQNVMASTADYLASIDSAQANSSLNSDLQLAIALQQQEFEQQQQQQQQEQQSQRILQQPAVSGGSRLVTGPQIGARRAGYPGSLDQ